MTMPIRLRSESVQVDPKMSSLLCLGGHVNDFPAVTPFSFRIAVGLMNQPLDRPHRNAQGFGRLLDGHAVHATANVMKRHYDRG